MCSTTAMHYVIVFYWLVMSCLGVTPSWWTFHCSHKSICCVVMHVKSVIIKWKVPVFWVLIGQYNIPGVVKYRYDVQCPHNSASPIHKRAVIVYMPKTFLTSFFIFSHFRAQTIIHFTNLSRQPFYF